jgi:septum formation topological specificity factor MinE
VNFLALFKREPDRVTAQKLSYADQARDRLKDLVGSDRAQVHAPDFLPLLRRDIADVISRYILPDSDVMTMGVSRNMSGARFELALDLEKAIASPLALLGSETARKASGGEDAASHGSRRVRRAKIKPVAALMA